MAVKPFSKEELNFFKFSKLVFHEFPNVLRQVFITMWDSKVAAVRPGFIAWNDSIAVRNMLLASEGGKTKIPTTKSIKEWDCTALFNATIYAKTFGLPSGESVSTLDDLYLRTTKPAPGSFRPSVGSSTGNEDETYALAIDQLRLLRNTLCHSAKSEIVKDDFDSYVPLVKNALSALNVDTSFVDDIRNMTEDDFPTKETQQLKECYIKELQANSMSRESIYQKLSSLETLVGNICLGGNRIAPDDSQSGPTPFHFDSTESSEVVQPSPAEQGPPTNSMTQNESGHPFESKELMRIATEICGAWQRVAKLTGMFKPWEIENIIGDQNYRNPILRADKMLNDFKSRRGTRKVLASAIEESRYADVAAKVLSAYYISNSD